jgi:Zn-dependent protease with chaperone function/tetratricopeptide (TPR) repeat protein
MKTPDKAPQEKPLSGGARLMLVLGVGVVMLSFYAFLILSIVFLSVLIAAELALFVVLLRFGASRLMVPYLAKHLGVLTLVVKSFWLKKGVEYRVPLQHEDAPALFKMLDELCRQLSINFPQEVVLQMGDGAWVKLKGIRSGDGKTTLGVGYDLLAGLSVAEIEAVMAHEMTHAKLINRGFRNWLWAGQSRIRSLAVALCGEVNNARRAKQKSSVAKFLFDTTDWLSRLSTRLVAAHSRQDEFEADLGAAQLCGTEVMKSALSKLDSLHQITSRLPWNERVAQLQQTSGYSQWLLQEIALGVTVPAENSNQALFNKYSTHPLISDRLAALPADDVRPIANSPPGIQLLAHPDEIAVKLVTELQKMLAEQEKQDSEALKKFSRKTGKSAYLQSWQGFGVLLVLAGVVCGIIALCIRGASPVFVFCFPAAIIAGVVAFRLGKYRDQFELSVPVYEKLVHPPLPPLPNGKIQEMQKAVEADLSQRFDQERSAKRAVLLAKESYAALANCDYLRAHVAANACLKLNKESVEGALALAVACAFYKRVPDALRLLALVQKKTGCKTFSTAWGFAWVGLLTGDWSRAEAMLERAVQLQPHQTNLLSLLAIAQSRRGKLQSSIKNARLACGADPASREKTKFLIARLLDGGYTREAHERIKQVQNGLESDLELMLSMAQLHLLQRNHDEAAEWTDRIKKSGASAHSLIRLGRFHESARLKDAAASLYQEALALDHFPEAHLGLGRLHAEKNNKEEARRHILAALNFERPVGKEGVNSWQMLQPILTQMLSLHEAAPNCGAWFAAFPNNGQPAVFAGKNFMVYAEDLPQAQQYFQTLLSAFQPNKPPVSLPPKSWSSAPRQLQPDGPVRPGVQGIWV